MPLKAFNSIPQDIIQWSRYLSSLVVKADPHTITDEAFANRSAASIIGRAGNSAGSPSDIVASADNTVLIRRAGTLKFDVLGLTDLPDSLATDAELAAGVTAAETNAAAGLAAHVAAADPHPQYTTAAEVSAAIAAAVPGGTFTPTVFGNTSAGTATYAIQLGKYTRIADLCFFNLRVQWSSATGTGNLRIGGLPVTASNAIPSLNSVVNVFVNDTNITDIVVGTVIPNTVVIQIEKFIVGTGHGFESVSAAGDLMISGFYPV